MNSNEIRIALKAGSHSPFDFVAVVDIDIVIDDDGLLDVVMRPKRGEEDVLRFARLGILNLYHQVVTVNTAQRQHGVGYAIEVPL